MPGASLGQRSTAQPSAATVAEGGSGKARSVQGSARQLHLCKELFFAGFPCQQPYKATTSTTTTAKSATATAVPSTVRPLSKKFVRGFFQQYGAVEALFYDEARGMGSVVFADGADAEGCYLAVHLSFIPATTEDGGIGQATWERDRLGEDLAERTARTEDLLLCLEFAHCCPFVNPVLLTREVFVDGGTACCEVPGGEVSRATLFHRFPQLLFPADAKMPQVPVAPHVVMRWKATESEGKSGRGVGDRNEETMAVATSVDGLEPQQQQQQRHATSSRVEVIEEEGEEEVGEKKKASTATPSTTPNTNAAAAAAAVLSPVGPSFPGRGIAPVEVEIALYRLLRPLHVTPGVDATVTTLDLWWEYYNVYMVHKTQPMISRIRDPALQYAGRPSLVQELLEIQRQGRLYAHGDEEAAQQVLQRLVYDHQYHNVLSYLVVKQKFKYDPVWASLMRDLYTDKVALQLDAWQTLMQEKESQNANSTTTTTSDEAAAAAKAVTDTEVRRRRVVMKAIHELIEPKPTKARDVAWVRRAEETWFELPRTTAAANVMENVRFLGKVRRGEVDRDGKDKDLSKRPTGDGSKNNNKSTKPPGTAEGAETAPGEATDNIESAYPSMSAKQREEQFYSEVMQNLDGYVAVGSAEELVSMCENPRLFRYAKGHIGYEEAHRQPSYWRAYLNALWVPLIAFLLLGFGSYYIVDRLGIQKVNEKMREQEQRREFREQLRKLVEQQDELKGASMEPENRQHVHKALRDLNETLRKASEAARKAGGKFNIEVRNDL